jgi:prolyl-tRNA synthetase
MKDLYSFSRTSAEHAEFYEKVKASYARIFDKVGLGPVTYLTFASGGMFAPYSHEFQTLTEAGEDTVYVDEEKKIAVNLEVCTDEVLADLGLHKENLVPRKAIEVGNIFSLGTRFADALNLSYRDEKGVEQAVIMGSYGIGPGRVMGAVVEVLADDKGLVWPAAIAPFAVHLLELPSANPAVRDQAERIYRELAATGTEVLWDDRDLKPGEKFAESDLLGIPWRLVVSDKTIAEGKLELKNRRTGEVTFADNADHVRTLL